MLNAAASGALVRTAFSQGRGATVAFAGPLLLLFATLPGWRYRCLGRGHIGVSIRRATGVAGLGLNVRVIGNEVGGMRRVLLLPRYGLLIVWPIERIDTHHSPPQR